MIDQELHKAAKRLYPHKLFVKVDATNKKREAFIKGYKLAQERSYSEEDMKKAFKVGFSVGYGSDTYATEEKDKTCEEWFEWFKK